MLVGECDERIEHMKKLIAWILILVLSLSLAACGGKTEPTAATTEAPPETTAAPEATEAVETTEEPTVLAKPLYGEILDAYFDALLQGFTLEQYTEKGLNYLVGVVGDVTKVGYSLEDLDGDGSMELLLGAVGAPEIYAMYTMKDGVETQVIDAGERNSYRLGTDGVFINQGSNSAAQSGTMLFTFENGELHFQDGLVSDFSVDEKNPWFYVKDQNWDPSTYEALDTESAEAIIAQLDANVRPISYIPFSEYQS